MEKIFNKEWFKAALIRAIKTIAQTALSMMSIGMAMSDINWLQVLSVSAVAGIFSILTSLAGLPETRVDGTLDMSDDKVTLKFNGFLDPKKKEKVTLNVKQ